MEVREPSARYLTPQTSSDLPDWQDVKLGAVASFRTGPFGSALHKSDYVFGGVPVVNPMQIEDGRIKPTEWMSVAEEAVERLSEFRLKNGDIVIGRRGEMGRCAFVQAGQEGWLCGTGSMIVRPGHSLDGRFAQRVLSSNQAVRAIESASVGTTMINLNQRTLAELNLRIPVSVDEQSLIADALSDADALIDSLEQLLTKKRQIKQGAMQELLTGKRRLLQGAEAWRQIPLGDVGRWSGGMTPSMARPDYWSPADVPWLSSGDLKTARLSESAKCISKVAVRDGATTVVPAKSVVVVMRSGILRKYFPVGMTLKPMAINQDLKAIQPNHEVAADFLLHALMYWGERILATCLKSGTTVESIEFRWLKAFTIGLPTVPEQEVIASVLSDMDTEITAIESSLTKARALKQAMAQALLIGRIRLVEPTA